METNRQNTGGSFFSTIGNDLRDTNILGDMRREYRELKSFYLDDERQQRLKNMSRFKGWLVSSWWLLKSLFLHLAPLRRLLVIIGSILIISSRSVSVNNVSVDTNEGLIGGVIILFVLMLELKDKLFAKDELEAGRKIQRAIMPQDNPSVKGWRVWMTSQPANEVGGDLVDYLKIDDLKTDIIIADVSGKGLQAALLTAKLQATIRALAPDYSSISTLCSKINTIFHRDSPANFFASMIYVNIEAEGNLLKYVNAGHLPPVLIKKSGIKVEPKGTAAVGLVSEFDYTETAIEMEEGEILVAFSDGITEAKNEYGQFFELDNFVKLLHNIKSTDIAEIGNQIMRQVKYFIGNASATDDISLVIIKKE